MYTRSHHSKTRPRNIEIRNYYRIDPTPIETDSITALLRATTYPHVYGEDIVSKHGKTGPKNVKPKYSREEFKFKYNNDFRRIKRWNNTDFGKHLTEQHTLYFQGSPFTTEPYTLVLVDIDCHEGQTGGKEAKEVISKYFPMIAWEAKGSGFHGYLLMFKLNKDPKPINKLLLQHFQPFVRHITNGIDIGAVEIKGTLPIIDYDRSTIREISYGQFGKLPRYVDVPELKRAVIHFDDLKDQTAVLPVLPQKSSQVIEKKKVKHGSFCSKHITDEMLAGLPAIERYADELLNGEVLLAKGSRVSVTTRDVAFALLLLRFFRANRNPDGSLPRARIEALWRAVVEAGDFDRSWHPARWTAIFHWLADRGYVEWENNHYLPGTEHKKGQACKWNISGEISEAVGVLISSVPSSADLNSAALHGGGGTFSTANACLNIEMPTPTPERCRPEFGSGELRPWNKLPMYQTDLEILLAA